MDENVVRGSRRRLCRCGAGGSSAAGSAAAADLLSIMHWVDGLVAGYVVRPGFPGRGRVIALATDVRAACRRLAGDPALGAAPPPFPPGNVLRFRRPDVDPRSGGGSRGRPGPAAGAGG